MRWQLPILTLLIAVAIIAAIVVGVVRIDQSKDGSGRSEPASAPAPSPITISEETTFITGPVDEYGYVDAVEALNRQASEGVTPENNAAVLLQRAFGPSKVEPAHRQEFYERLGMKVPPEEGEYLVEFSDFLQEIEGLDLTDAEVDAFLESQEATQENPWRADDHPRVAQWLLANERQVSLICQAVQHKKLYVPLIPFEEIGGPLFSAILLPMADQARPAARALTARAMLHLGEGRSEAAISDLLDCHRFARLIGQGPCLVDSMVAYALEDIAHRGDLALGRASSVSPQQLITYRQALTQLPRLPSVAEKLDSFERLALVDYVNTLASGTMSPKEISSVWCNVLTGLVAMGPDWNETLREGNRWWDRAVAAMGLPTFQQQQAESDQVWVELMMQVEQLEDPSQFVLVPALHERVRKLLIGQRVGEILAMLLLPAVNSCVEAETRSATTFDLGQLALSLAAYRAERGVYPDSLDALAPKYLPKIPTDRFTGDPLVYRTAADGYVLYSLGPNLQDDDGTDSDTAQDQNDSLDYDIVVRVPAKAATGDAQ